MGSANPLETCTGFDWDEFNELKNWDRHRVRPEEAEQVFLGEPLVLRSDVRHSAAERRYYVLGRTDVGRRLFVAFVIRESLIRVISARDMNRKERETYRQHEEKSDT